MPNGDDEKVGAADDEDCKMEVMDRGDDVAGDAVPESGGDMVEEDGEKEDVANGGYVAGGGEEATAAVVAPLREEAIAAKVEGQSSTKDRAPVSNGEERKRGWEKETLKLAGYEFEDREALWRHVSEVQRKLESGAEAVATAEDAFFLFLLLAQHPAAHEKMAPGVCKIGFGVNEEYPETKSFFVVRTDGTRAGFSARKCIDAVYEQDEGPTLFSKRRKFDDAHFEKRDFEKRDFVPPPRFNPGTIVTISGLEGQAITFSEIKDVLGQYALVRFVDVNEDLGTASVRFDTADGAQRAVSQCAEINGCKATLAIATPEEEERFRKNFEQRDQSRAKAFGGPRHNNPYSPRDSYRGRGFRGGGFGGRGGGRGRFFGGGTGRGRGKAIGRGIRGGGRGMHY
ncbi:hypothetical protein CTAYLR_001794 [Chrysophaeum taylorii]|uniref:RRM domain-containing protein n=1 Tax=Chrysophaeum taylorii TaxID=2483200 RepID=A0AAD7UEX7_9STRA|nr:hypothetical protein CTAYLR_001794 [Chrysophaeum taylorii]